MAQSDLTTVGNVVKFDVYAAELGVNFNGVEVSSVMSYASAAKRRDVDAVHQQVYSRLPTSVPNDPKKYNYVEVITASGEPVVLGIPWIKESTITLMKTMVYRPSIFITSAEDVTVINQVLEQAGFSVTASELVPQ